MAGKPVHRILPVLVFLLLGGCGSQGHEARLSVLPDRLSTGIRFLLTFDDGPAVDGTTLSVLQQLRLNKVQPEVKAIFFVQTRSPRNGGSGEGWRMMEQEHAEEHLLALHSGSVHGHVNHTVMKPLDLQQTLEDGMSDISRITGRRPLFVRPTFWRYNAETLARYENNGLSMVLSDVKAYDGGSGLLHFGSMFSSQRKGSMLSELQRVRARIERGDMPIVNGVIPVVVTFHDTNSFTAGHLEEYLHILVDEARRAGLTVSSKPFYDNREELETAALEKAEHRVLLETRLPARLSRFFKRS
jgi:peptidoglycan/xylan/chitin deacetylase (PgdA/CDA1 family)